MRAAVLTLLVLAGILLAPTTLAGTTATPVTPIAPVSPERDPGRPTAFEPAAVDREALVVIMPHLAPPTSGLPGPDPLHGNAPEVVQEDTGAHEPDEWPTAPHTNDDQGAAPPAGGDEVPRTPDGPIQQDNGAHEPDTIDQPTAPQVAAEQATETAHASEPAGRVEPAADAPDRSWTTSLIQSVLRLTGNLFEAY